MAIFHALFRAADVKLQILDGLFFPLHILGRSEYDPVLFA